MKQSFTRYLNLLLLALALGTGYRSWGQTYTPIALTGFTQDIVANGPGAVTATTTADIDGGAAAPFTGYCLMSQDYVGPTGQVPNNTTYPALENNGLITSALNSAITFQLASYSANNALRLYGAGATGTLTFATPSAASELYVVGTSGSAASSLDITVTFADGTSQTFNGQVIPDWFTTNQPNVVRQNLGRVSRADNTVQYTGSPVGPRLYQTKLTLLGGNVAKNIVSIGFNKAAAAGTTVIMAVTAGVYPLCTTPPTNLSATATTTSGGTTALTSACTDTNIYLSVTGVPANAGYTYQWQASTTSATAGFSNITGATSSTYTATGQTATTYYRVLVSCQFATGGTPTASSAVQVTQNAVTNCYCIPTYANGGAGDIVARVQLGTLDNNTGSLGNPTPYYRDYTTAQTGAGATLQVPVLTPGGNAAVTITFGSDGNQRGAIWIDFNQNGVLGDVANEYVGTTTTTGANSVVTLTLPVPTAAVPGTTRMRIRGGDDTNTPTQAQACGASGSVWGEGEDYLVNIVPGCTPTSATFSYGTATSYCASGSTNPTVTLGTGSAAGTFTSTTGLTINATTGAITLSSSTPGTYTVTNTVAAAGTNCASTATTTVIITTPPTANFSYPSSTTCAGAAATLTPTLATGATAGTFSLPAATGLSVNATTGVVTATTAATAGVYTVTNTVTSGGCATVTSTASFTLTTGASSAFSYPAGPYCTSGTTNPTPTVTGTTGGTFSSTTGLTINATTGAITLGSSTAGVYTITYSVTGTCGSSSSTQSLTINAAPTAGFSYPTATRCAGTATTLTPTSATGATAGTYSLPAAAGLTINATTGVVTVGTAATAGTYTVTNTVAAANGCVAVTSTATFVITTQTTATFSYPAGPFCTSGTTNPTPTITGTAGGTFSSGTGLTINATTGVVTLSSSTSGTYTVTYTVAGACGSSTTQSLTINSPATAGFSYPTTAVCVGTATTLTPTLATGATAGTYTLPATASLSINATTGVVTVGATATAGTYTVTNTVTSGGCAAVTSTATFTVTPQTTATFSYATGPYCVSGTTNPTPTVTGTTGGTFSSPTGLTINATTGAIALGSSTAGTYTVTYTVAGLCGSSSTQSVTINAAPTASFSYATPGLGAACAGGTGTFTPTLTTGATAGLYSSTLGLTINATTGVINLATSTPGTYTITNTVAANGGCAAVTSTATFTVNAVPTTPTLSTTGTPATGITLTSSATTGNQFYLGGVAVPGATGQTLLVNSGTKNGTYTVVTTSAAGCSSAASAPVNVTVTATTPAAAGTSLTLYPNPTRDGLLTLELSGYQETVQVSIVNALGQRVYESTISGGALNQKQALNLHELATGVYLLQARTASGSVETRRFVRE